MDTLFGLVIIFVLAILFTFCLGVLVPAVVFSVGTVAASFGILFVGLFIVTASTQAVLKSLK